MRINIMKPNARRITTQNPSSMLKILSKLTDAGNIKVANKYCNKNFISIPANNINYTNKPIGA